VGGGGALPRAAPASALVRVAVLALLGLQAGVGLLPAFETTDVDFPNYYVTARAVVDGRTLDDAYDRSWFLAEARRAGLDVLGSFVPQPPANALLLVPLARLGPGTAKAVWTLALAACTIAAFLALRDVVALDPWTIALLFLVPAWSLRNALVFGQPYPLILLCLSASFRCARRGREARAGLWLAPVLVLKLYAVAFLPYFALARRWRALASAVAGTALLASLSLAVLGPRVHRAYAREVLTASLAGAVQDPYATSWQSITSLGHRLFVREPDRNPEPALDRPALARAVAAGFPAAVLVVAVLAAAAGDVARAWTVLMLGALAASPLPASYHFVLLTLPAALLLERRELGRNARVLVWGVLAFASSPLPHYFGGLATGWGNLAAYPRLWAVAALFVLAARRALGAGPLAVALGLAGLAAARAGATAPREEPGWMRVSAAGGYTAAAPLMCEGRLTWLAVESGRLRRVAASGPALCEIADEAASGSSEAPGLRHGRVSPDGRRVAFERWRGSWDLAVLDRATGAVGALTADPANEVEPSWLDADHVVFASDRRRGLGSTALYVVDAPRP
jgi:hypothetical protein